MGRESKIEELIRSHGMKNNQDLQAYFNEKLQKIVQKHGKIMVGWDEVLHPDLPKTVVVQSWRGQESLAAAVKQGYRGLLSYGYYLDLMWPASRHYAIDPMTGDAANLTPDQAKMILGGEAACGLSSSLPKISILASGPGIGCRRAFMVSTKHNRPNFHVSTSCHAELAIGISRLDAQFQLQRFPWPHDWRRRYCSASGAWQRG